MRINISSGDCLNEILQNKYSSNCDFGKFIPFREAMIEGSFSSAPFSDGFCAEQTNVHGVAKDDYLEKLFVFIDYLNCADEYDETILWFGDEPFCVENRKVILKALAGSHRRLR